MKYIETRIETGATPQEVWNVLMDFASYPSWNPMVVSIEGAQHVGAALRVTIAMKGGRRMRFNPTVVEHAPVRRFAWLGKLWIRRLFDGLHRFEVEPRSGGATFIHSEEFGGLLPVLAPKLLADTHEGLIAMNEALVREVERRGSHAESDGPLLNAKMS